MKYNRVLAIVYIVSILFSQCNQEPPTLTFAVGGAPSEVEYLEVLIKKFEEKNNITVKILRQPTDTDQRRQGLVIPLKAKEKDPDVFLMDVIWVGQFAASDWLQPLTRYIDSDTVPIDVFFQSIVDHVDTYGEELVALPLYIDCGLLYYRKDLLEKYHYSVPQTWDKFVRCAQDIQKHERVENPQFYGFIWQGAQYEGLICTFLEFAASHGGGMVDKNGKIVVNSEENIAALALMKNMIHNYKISPPHTFTEMKEEEVRLFFDAGNALFERNWPYAWSLHERKGSQVRGETAIALLPKTAHGDNAAALGGWHIGISKYSDNKDNAWKLIKFLVAYETQKELTLNLGWNPSRSDIYDDRVVKEVIPHIAVLKKAFENAVARPNLPYYTQLSEILQRYINACLSNKYSPHDALLQAQQEITQMVDIYHVSDQK
jgi:multiple sugar transport system substrate-binding protein